VTEVGKGVKTEVKPEVKVAGAGAGAGAVASRMEEEVSDSTHTSSSTSRGSTGNVQEYQVEGGWVGGVAKRKRTEEKGGAEGDE
jgi:hypothetical protein